VQLNVPPLSYSKQQIPLEDVIVTLEDVIITKKVAQLKSTCGESYWTGQGVSDFVGCYSQYNVGLNLMSLLHINKIYLLH